LMKELYKHTTVIILLNKADIVSAEDKKTLTDTIREKIEELDLTNVYHTIFEVISRRQCHTTSLCPSCGQDEKGKLMVSSEAEENGRGLVWFCRICKEEGYFPLTEGLEDVIDATVDTLGEHVKTAFIGAQEVSTRNKDLRAEQIIQNSFEEVKTGWVKNKKSVENVAITTLYRLAELWNFQKSCYALLETLDSEPWFPNFLHRFSAAWTGWWDGEAESRLCLTVTCIAYYRIIRVLSFATCYRISSKYKIKRDLLWGDKTQDGVTIQNEISKMDNSAHLSALIIHYFHGLMQFQYKSILEEWRPDFKEKIEMGFNIHELFFEHENSNLRVYDSLRDWSPCQVSKEGEIIALEVDNIEGEHSNSPDMISRTVSQVANSLKEVFQ